ncbi:MAG TPA: type II secretion system protein [Patescibacteria group bacterium]|jgi:type II secretory pathway pseudopilin PulG|nr:type II secretion system protein [Patescibacteria group bacterium]
MKINNKNGYTLVELLAVIFILVAVGTIIASILTSVLRTSNKSANTENVRRNGNYAISQMSKMITYAQKLEGVSTDGIQYYTDCVSLPTATKYKYLKIESFDGGITTFACANSQIASQSSSGSLDYLVDPTMYASCYFNCSQESAAAPIKIDIFLDLKATNSAVFSENQAEIPFETSVVLRNSANR